MNQSSIQILVPLVIVAAVMVFRMRGVNRERRLKLELMWIMPALLLAMMAAVFTVLPPRGMDWVWLAAIFALGGAIGWWRGKLMPIGIDPETHLLNVKTSPAALLFIVGLLVVRQGLRTFLESEASAWHLNAALLADGFMVLGVSLLVVSRVEMALRAWSLLRQARAAKAAA